MRRARLVGDLLMLIGGMALLLGGTTYVADRVGDGSLPRPATITDQGTEVRATDSPLPLATEPPTPTRLPSAAPVVATRATSVPTSTPTPLPAGVPIRVIIPSINVDSPVREAGTYWSDGQLYYETLPFVVAHYRMTARVGEVGNAVFSGHVTSRSAGNVFADLYRVQIGDEIRFFSEEHQYIYRVTAMRLVDRNEVGVMAPTPDATATLITCAGEWIPAERQYSQRLIVTAKLRR